jgi:hypothetical protein|tara:strand:+ start:686 stop:943 length:258 start_codon:yes stop_codon:yes gene_type:complete
MTNYTKIYNETCKVQVQKVKLGDVTYSARCKLALLEELLQDAEKAQVHYKDIGNDTLTEWTQGKIEAYKMSIEILNGHITNCNKL